MAGWRVGVFGVRWPVLKGEPLDVVAIDFGRVPIVQRVIDGEDAQYIIALVAGHSTFESIGHTRHERNRLYLLAVGREPRADYSLPVFEAHVVVSVALGRLLHPAIDALFETATALSHGLATEDDARAQWQAVAR